MEAPPPTLLLDERVVHRSHRFAQIGDGAGRVTVLGRTASQAGGQAEVGGRR